MELRYARAVAAAAAADPFFFSGFDSLGFLFFRDEGEPVAVNGPSFLPPLGTAVAPTRRSTTYSLALLGCAAAASGLSPTPPRFST